MGRIIEVLLDGITKICIPLSPFLNWENGGRSPAGLFLIIPDGTVHGFLKTVATEELGQQLVSLLSLICSLPNMLSK